MLRSRVAVAEPSDAQLLLYMREHDARYRQPARASFMHVFLSRARRGAALASDAAELLARLTRENARPTHPGTLSDPTILPLVLEQASAREIDARLGPGVGEQVLASPLATWCGPLSSSYGLHLVLVREHSPGRLPGLSDVKARVRGDYLHDEKRKALTRELLRLRQHYAIEVKRSEA
jgi:hypothetical protein